jgi:hypothetical protein
MAEQASPFEGYQRRTLYGLPFHYSDFDECHSEGSP